MTTSHATVPTSNAGKYLVQLSKHWSHKFPDLTYSETHADIPFPDAKCTLDAGPEALVVTIATDSPEQAERLEGVVQRHIERFAFRETLAFHWTQSEDPPHATA